MGLLVGFGCTPAQDCNRNPGHEDCFNPVDAGPHSVPLRDSFIQDAGPGEDGGIFDPGAYLSYKNLGLENGECAHFKQRILWTFPGGAPANGWIIQKMTVSATGYRPEFQIPGFEFGLCMEAEAALNLTYWEAWKVAKGEQAVTYLSGVDLWKIHPLNIDGVVVTFAGEAVYRPGALPAGFAAGVVALAGRLPSTYQQPAFWGGVAASQKLVRVLKVEGRCCPPQANVVLTNDHSQQ